MALDPGSSSENGENSKPSPYKDVSLSELICVATYKLPAVYMNNGKQVEADKRQKEGKVGRLWGGQIGAKQMF